MRNAETKIKTDDFKEHSFVVFDKAFNEKFNRLVVVLKSNYQVVQNSNRRPNNEREELLYVTIPDTLCYPRTMMIK